MISRGVSRVVLGWGLLLLPALPAHAQATQVPASLVISLPATEATQGARLPVTLAVRNVREERVRLREPITVTIESDLLPAPIRQAIPAGSDSAIVQVQFDRPGIVKLRASAPRLPVAYAVIAIKRRAPARAAWPGSGLTGRFFPVLEAASAQPGAAASSTAGVRLWLEVLPPRVTPRGNNWTAKVLVAAVNDRDEPVEMLTDVPVSLAATVGTVSPDTLVIARGASTVTDDVRVKSTAAGTDTIYARSPMIQGRAEQKVEYERSRPTRVVVTATPSGTETSGRSSVVISVLLKDEDGHVVPNPAADLPVILASSRGTLLKGPAPAHVVIIPRGSPTSDDLILSSGRSGTAVVTAYAEGLEGGSLAVPFTFPWLLILLAAIGGVAGAVLRSPRGVRRAQLPRNLGIGALLGAVFFALVLSGIPGLVPVVPVQAVENLTLNEIGAFLLGLFGGYLGRQFLDRLLGARVAPHKPVTA